MGGKKITTHRELQVYQRAFDAAMEVFRLTRIFPNEERYALANQIRRSSRSVCAAIAEAWGRRRYQAAFINKLNEAEGEAAETQVWLEFCVACGYVKREEARTLYGTYNAILRTLVGMINHPSTWIISTPRK
jgi:four helix bundle protein